MSSIKAYRLLKRKWATTAAFDGEGARLHGGRWNSIGVPCVYLAQYESLSILETIVHLSNKMELHDWCMYELEIEEDALLRLKDSDLPSDWFKTPAPAENSELGDEWLSSKSSVGLLLPSTIARRDNNIMLNPAHPDFKSVVKTAKEIKFFVDGRL